MRSMARRQTASLSKRGGPCAEPRWPLTSRVECACAQVPITFVDRVYGLSKLGNAEILAYLQGLWSLMWS